MDWAAPVRTAQGRTVPASETVWMRTREVWIHAVDLDNGAQFSDFPDVVLESLLADIVEAWRRQRVGTDLVLEMTGLSPSWWATRADSRSAARCLRSCDGPRAAVPWTCPRTANCRRRRAGSDILRFRETRE
jgi:maleylpyruvate isomerase